MFVAELDRPWTESPFLLQGFLIQTEDEISQISEICDYVIIDPARSSGFLSPGVAEAAQGGDAEILNVWVVQRNRAGGEESRQTATPQPTDAVPSAALALSTHGVEHIRITAAAAPRYTAPADHASDSARKLHASLGFKQSFVEYATTTPVVEEVATVKPILEELNTSINQTIARYRATQIFEVEKVQDVSNNLVASVIRSPDAAQLLAQLRLKDACTYLHSVEAFILAALFGRHLGLTSQELKTLSLGVLLMDIGKLRIPTALLEKRGKLTPVEVRILRRHIDYSLAILARDGVVDPEIVAIVRYHHERFDGTGYPSGKSGQDIPVYARMAAIIDFYDAVTHARPYRKEVPTSVAINALYQRRGTHFQPELVEEFIQALGVYPTGTLVELSSGEVGIVIAQNRSRRLRPTVLILRDAAKKEVKTPFPRDLNTEPQDAGGRKLFIKSALAPGAYGVNADDFYL